MRTAAAAKPGAGLPSHPRAGSSVPAPQPLGLAAGSPWAPVPAPSAPLACKLLTHPGPGTSEPAQDAILPGSLPAPALTGKESSAPAPAAQRGAGPTIHLHPKLIQHFPVPLPRFQPPRPQSLPWVLGQQTLRPKRGPKHPARAGQLGAVPAATAEQKLFHHPCPQRSAERGTRHIPAHRARGSMSPLVPWQGRHHAADIGARYRTAEVPRTPGTRQHEGPCPQRAVGAPGAGALAEGLQGGSGCCPAPQGRGWVTSPQRRLDTRRWKLRSPPSHQERQGKRHKPGKAWCPAGRVRAGSCCRGAGTHPRGPATQSLTALDAEGQNRRSAPTAQLLTSKRSPSGTHGSGCPRTTPTPQHQPWGTGRAGSGSQP